MRNKNNVYFFSDNVITLDFEMKWAEICYITDEGRYQNSGEVVIRTIYDNIYKYSKSHVFDACELCKYDFKCMEEHYKNCITSQKISIPLFYLDSCKNLSFDNNTPIYTTYFINPDNIVDKGLIDNKKIIIIFKNSIELEIIDDKNSNIEKNFNKLINNEVVL